MKTSTLARSTEVSSSPPRFGLDEVDLVDVGGEQEERGQRRGRDRIALGQGLRRVADRVEAVRDLARAGLGPAELGDAAGVVRDRAERVHRQDVGGRHEHRHRGDGGSEDAAHVATRLVHDAGLAPEPVADEQGDADGDRGQERGLEADRRAGNDVGGRARPRCLCDLADRPVRTRRVVLGDVDERDARCQADDAGTEEVQPDRQPGRGVAVRLEHHVRHEEQRKHGQDRRDPVAAVEHVHRVLVFLAANEEDRDDRREEAEGSDDEREEDPGRRIGPARGEGDRVNADTEDHRADVLGRGGLEQVGAAAGAVADVVADEVRHHARVPGVVLGDALLDLADEVRTDVGGLRVDPAAELGEEGDERGAEPEADDEERGVVGRLTTAEATE